MKKLKNKIYKFIFKGVIEKIDNLEDKIFNTKKVTLDSAMDSLWTSWTWGNYTVVSLEEEIIILQDRLDALEKYLKVKDSFETKEEGWKVKKIKTIK